MDGDCGFCLRAAGLAERLAGGRYAVLRWQSVPEETLAAHGLTPTACAAALQWVGPHGHLRAGHLAVAEALRSASVRAVRPLGVVLGSAPLARPGAAAYRLVARHRHRLPGGTDACALESP